MSKWLVSGREHSGKGWAVACYAESREQALRDAWRLANDPQAWRETRVDELPLPGNGPRHDAPAMLAARAPLPKPKGTR